MKHRGRELLLDTHERIVGRHLCPRCYLRRKLFAFGDDKACYDCWQNDALSASLSALIEAIDEKWKKTIPPKQLIEPLAQAKAILNRQ